MGEDVFRAAHLYKPALGYSINGQMSGVWGLSVQAD